MLQKWYFSDKKNLDKEIMADPILPGKRVFSEPSPNEKASSSPKKAHKETSTVKEAILTSGPFKGLPSPFQASDYESHFPYIPCNEEEQSKTLAFLTSNPSLILSTKKVFLGFSVWFNFDLISSTKPAFAIICDIDNHVINIYKAISEGLKISDNRFKFMEYFRDYLLNNSDKLFKLEETEVEKIFKVENELTRAGSWLSLEQHYQAVRELHQKGCILFLRLNITDDVDLFKRIANWMKENELELDTLYTSNIIEWNPNQLKQQAYLQNLKMIASPHTRFIQAYKPGKTGSPIQFCTIGVDSIKLPVKRAKKIEKK